MAYCSKCGAQINDDAVVCIHCGCSVYHSAPVSVEESNLMDKIDTGSFGWAVLGFLYPIVGFILFCIWKNTQPRNAKRAGVGALVGVILAVLAFFITLIFIIAIVSAVADMSADIISSSGGYMHY